MKWNRQFKGLAAMLVLASAISPAGQAFAALEAQPYGTIIDSRTMELAPGAAYSWYDMQIGRGAEKMHVVEFDPKNPNLALRAGTKSGKVYGMQGVTQMANYADKPGNRVIAGINGDFYDISGYATGVPDGLFMDEGRILNSSTSSFAFGLTADGQSLYGSPKLTKTVTIGGKTSNLTHINRYRDNNQLVLFTADYNASTKTANTGDEVVLAVESGAVKNGETMQLKVVEVRKGLGDSPLTDGRVVLSAAGTARDVLVGLQIGDTVTASFALAGEWAEAELAIGGQGPLIKDGDIQTNVGPTGVHPRTAIGTKADGSIVLFEIDGRAPGFSEGVETEELGELMEDLGVVDAMNLDGGGSSTFVTKMPGETARKMLNRGSDGGERQTGNGLLLINTAPEGEAAKLAVQPAMERVLTGATISLKAAGIDANGHPATVADAIAWTADPAIGTAHADGSFTAGSEAGTGQVQASAGELTGSSTIEVVDQLTALAFPDAVKSFTSGQQSALSVKALRDGQVIQASNDSFTWRVEGEIGTIDANGVFQAVDANDRQGKIIVSYGDVQTSMEVSIGVPPVVLEDFEGGLGNYNASGAAYNTVKIDQETNEDFVRTGASSLKLSYDFVGKTGTSGAYLSAKSTAQRIQVTGYPEKIGMWVYGDGQKHWLRGQMRDGNNAAFAIDFTDQTSGVNWTGWKYVEATVPKGKAVPLTMDLPVRYMETSNTNKTSGAIYIDGIRAVYGPLSEDRTPPLIKQPAPANGAVVNTGTPEIRFIGEDDGYDPVTSPGTTLIDPAKIRLYVDGQQVQYGFYPPQGRVSYKPSAALDDGIHTVKAAIRDLAGNQTIQEWSFTVETGAAKLAYTTPMKVFAGHSYSVDITGMQAAKLKSGHLEFAFDLSKTAELQVVRGAMIPEDSLETQLDASTGIARITFSDLDSLGLTDADTLAQIKYRVKGDAAGTNAVTFRSGSALLAGEGQTVKTFNGPSLQSVIQQELQLTWDDNIGQGFATTFKVTDAAGEPVAAASLLADGVDVGNGTLVTDEDGKLQTSALTEVIKEYKVQAVKGEQYSPVVSFKPSKLAGSAEPYNIGVSMGADPAKSRGFNWHTHPSTDKTVVELVRQADFAGFDQPNVTRIEGTSYLYNTLDLGTIRVHKAVAEGLAPGTAYVYRVGNGEGLYSAQGTFETAKTEDGKTSFLVLGDSQASDEAGFKLWGDTLKTALTDRPDSEFIVHLGDIVDNGFKEQEWNWWFAKAQEQLMSTTTVSLVGNHEVTGTKLNGDFLAHFNHPQNGVDSQKGTNYSFDYENVHIAVLNSEYELDKQKEWLRTDLGSTSKKWKMVFFHRGPYGSIYDSANVREAWTPILDEYGVDVVMNGHDHIYLRTYPMKGGSPVAEGQGTTYIIPGATGPKFYEQTERPWQQIIDDENTQMYASVDITQGSLTVTTKTIGGRVVDTFELAKEDPEPFVSPHFTDQAGPVQAGESFDLTYGILGLKGQVIAQDITVNYDPERAEFTGFGDVLKEGVQVVEHEEEPGQVRFVAVDLSGEANGSNERLLQLGFKARGLQGETYISISNAVIGLEDGQERVIGGAAHLITVDVADRTALVAAIAEAQALHDASVEGKAVGQYPAGSKAALQAAIDAASTVADNAYATDEQIASASAALAGAEGHFRSLIIKKSPSDVNGNGQVSIGDLAIVAAAYGKDSTSADWSEVKEFDFNEDGSIGIEDLVYLARKILDNVQ